MTETTLKGVLQLIKKEHKRHVTEMRALQSYANALNQAKEQTPEKNPSATPASESPLVPAAESDKTATT